MFHYSYSKTSMSYGTKNVKRGYPEGSGGGGSAHNYPSGNIPQGRVIPGFLIVQKNGVIRMNKNYKGEPYGPEVSALSSK